MNRSEDSAVSEIASIARKSDQACSIHARLRDRYQSRANYLDYGLLAASTYLIGLTLVEPSIGLPLSLGFDRLILITILSLVTFFLSIVQFKSDLKMKTQAHQRSASEYAKIKAECRFITSGTRNATVTELQRIRDSYDIVEDLGTYIPDNEFITGKGHHKRKVFVSQYLDTHPGAWIPLVRLKLFLRDNLNIDWLD